MLYQTTSMPHFEFHISQQARQRYQFDQALFSLSGNVIFADFHAARLFADKMNAQRNLEDSPDQVVKAGQIHAMGLIDEILHLMARQYRLQFNPLALEKALTWLEEKLGGASVNEALLRFVEEFPPITVHRGEISPQGYLQGRSDGMLNRQTTLEEILLLWLANTNPAFAPYLELFDDRSLTEETHYSQIIQELGAFFETQPRFGPQNQTLIEVLRAPALASPDSLEGQLDFIRTRWDTFLGEYIQRLLKSLDFIKEEEKPVFFGPGPALAPQYPPPGVLYDLFEEERFSPDSDWMPRLVLIAKNAYVWLDQLSKAHLKEIRRLDQVPDEELDTLARWGISGLWLIGLWERSPASQRIKQLCGNPDAVSSAYSLYDYIIADDLGGEEAYLNLRQRAWQRGIHLAADMVPNHVGIYSKWVVEHPEWFVSLEHSPFPTYTFNGENLSHDPRVGIYLEDHYYEKSDAAVVFKRSDHWTGDARYIYHGNDGTAMPWNDTAQLDYLNPEVREAAIQTILHVARKFPIIRFDAAMTLTKKHFQRLWFPEPGSGGDIPSRTEFGITRAQFDAAMPAEFWREVVDRVAQEIPDTLLLAEAFWMMEGYFVRTLGMHRVYNSAFMHMLRDENNAEYRKLIKNTLEFDPQILKRYVNFMNNPDEDTAIAQFGHDDKYFGICIMMATLPGLPMFGHGQIEGFHEKYGMEYRRAYWDEYPDTHLVARHERQVFPLLHRRAQFAEVDNFYLFDFYTPQGRVDENVFAYSNHIQGQCSLVVYHNRWADARGWVKTSAAYLDKASEQLRQTHLAAALGLDEQPDRFTIFREHISGLEYIRANTELHERGLYVELGAYKYQVFLDFRQVTDNEWNQYRQLSKYLDGRGVPNIEETLKEILLQPLLYPFRALVNPESFTHLLDIYSQAEASKRSHQRTLLTDTRQKLAHFFNEIERMTEIGSAPDAFIEIILQRLAAFFDLPAIAASASDSLAAWLLPEEEDLAFWGVLLAWLFTHPLGSAVGATAEETPAHSRTLLDDWLLAKILEQTLAGLGLKAEPSQEGALALKVLVQHQAWSDDPGKPASLLKAWFNNDDIQRLLRINDHRGTRWFHKESFEKFLRWMLIVALLEIYTRPKLTQAQKAQAAAPSIARIENFMRAAAQSDFQVEKLLQESGSQ